MFLTAVVTDVRDKVTAVMEQANTLLVQAKRGGVQKVKEEAASIAASSNQVGGSMSRMFVVGVIDATGTILCVSQAVGGD